MVNRSKRGGNKNTSSNRAGGVRDLIVVPRMFGFTAPRVRVTLRYSVTGTVNNAGFTTANRVFVPTNAFDVDTSLGSTTMPGFNEWAGLYRRYRTRASSIQVDFVNQETIPLICAICPLSANPTQNHSATVTTQLIAQPICKVKPIGSLNGNSITTIRMHKTTAQMAGAADLNIADDYASAVTGAPLLNWYWDVILYAGGGILANGALVHISVDIELEFFDVGAPPA